MMPMRSGQRGVALIAAIFLIVVLALLGVYMVSITGVQQATTSQAIVAARVYYGAKAGLDWGIYQAIGPTSSSCAATTTLAPITGIDGVTVTVTCACTFTTTACTTSADSVYYLTSTATFGTYGSAAYAQRVLEATITNQ
jgi:MSHA biogenesis protein MshP